MKSFGKGLFWIGFILLMGVVIGYLITMLAGVVAFASWVTALTFCGLISRWYFHAHRSCV